MTIQEILYECRRGNFFYAFENSKMINDRILEILDTPDNDLGDMIYDLADIIKIGNYTYNNTDIDALPIDDGVYDLLVVKLTRINPNMFTPGALPVINCTDRSLYQIDEGPSKTVKPFTFAPQDFEDWLSNTALYPEIITKGSILDLNKKTKPFIMDGSYDYNPLSKRVRDTSHNYPELVGTLHKCKFVTDSQAIDKGVYDNPNVSILERDFFAPLLTSGIIDQYRPIKMVATLKYDGISIEADVNTEVISARTRGDTDLDKAADVSEILAGYKFPYARELDKPIGMKFEAIITNENLNKLNRMFGTKYINGRTAIIGIFGSSDARKYRDFITLVPLQCDIGTPLDRMVEIDFLNKYYTTDEMLRYQEFELPFNQLLFAIKRYTEEAEKMRPYMRFMYDGIVVEFLDPEIRKILGRKNSINQYAMAVKFNTLKRITTFTGFTYTIGQNGQVTPMIHYNPVEFMGAIHTKTTGSSLARVRKLDLYVGDQIEVEYVNDVIPYVNKVHSKFNDLNHRRDPSPAELFPKYCPCCGSELYITDIAVCTNLNCPERVKQRMSNMLRKLGINDFADSAVEILKVKSFHELMNMTPDDMVELGPTNCIKLYKAMQNLKVNKLEDYRLIGALGFSNIAAKTWKLIFREISLKQLMETKPTALLEKIVAIKGCGNTTAQTIINEMGYFYNDLRYIFDHDMYKSTTGLVDTRNIKIRCTGFRDSQLMSVLNMDERVDADDSAGVTKDTSILLIPIEGFKSSKVDKAIKYGVKVVPVKDFLEHSDDYIVAFSINDSL